MTQSNAYFLNCIKHKLMGHDNNILSHTQDQFHRYTRNFRTYFFILFFIVFLLNNIDDFIHNTKEPANKYELKI